MHKETVDAPTLELIKELQSDPLLKDYVLVGGTALSLQIGHRKSIDIDLFTQNTFNSDQLSEKLENKYSFQQEIMGESTLIGSIQGVKVDLIKHGYPNIRPLTIEEGIKMASIDDIAAMKVNAICNSGERVKDFVDVYFLLKNKPMNEIVDNYSAKYQQRNPAHAVRSLNYFDDVDLSDWPNMILEKSLNWNQVKLEINKNVLQYQKKLILSPEQKLSKAIYSNNNKEVEQLLKKGVKPNKSHLKLLEEMKASNLKVDPKIESLVNDTNKQNRSFNLGM